MDGPGPVDRAQVEKNRGVYFYTYSVPETILVNRGVQRKLGPGAEIFHHSIVHSDGEGVVETITAGPEEPTPWLKQLGFTPIKPQIAFLAHPDNSRIERNFDSTAWAHPEITQAFVPTNWSDADFEFAKRYVHSVIKRISAVGYNLAGHNSNSMVRLLANAIARNRKALNDLAPDDPNHILDKYFRPGSTFDLLERSTGYYRGIFANWYNIARIAKRGILKLERQDFWSLAGWDAREPFGGISRWWRKWRGRV